MKRLRRVLTILCLVTPATSGFAETGRDANLAALVAEAQKADPSFAGFPPMPANHFGWRVILAASRTHCLVLPTIQKIRKPRVKREPAKAIDPMAVSANPQRFTDPEKVAKWFMRNCNAVLGRECTPQEKGDVVTFLTAQ